MEAEERNRETQKEFEIKDLGAATRILGIQIIRDRHAKTLFLTQANYVEKVWDKFIMDKSKLVLTPVSTHFRLSKSQEPITKAKIKYMNKVLYFSAVDSIIYAMIYSRPDLAHEVKVVSIFMRNPGKEDWSWVKYILRYFEELLEKAFYLVE